MKKILVTGGAGFVGSNIIELLRSLSYHIVSIDNYSTGSIENHFNHVYYYDLDILDVNKKNGFDYENIDCIIHCAAKARIKHSWQNVNNYLLTNVAGTQSICEFAYTNNIPLIYIGSGSHHGGKFLNPYTFTKDLGEDVVRLYQKSFNLNASIARLYNVYGPRQLCNDNGTFIGKLLHAYSNKETFYINGDGEQRRDFTHINDVRSAILSIIIKQAYNETFEIGSGTNFSLNEIINLLDYKANTVYNNQIPKGEMISTLANNHYTKKILNWNPTQSLTDYILGFKNVYT